MISNLNVGDGTSQNIIKVNHIKTGETRIIKILQKEEKNKDPLREIKILQSIDHPNILKLHEVYEDDKNYYLITEYVEGSDLVDVLCNQNSNLLNN